MVKTPYKGPTRELHNGKSQCFTDRFVMSCRVKVQTYFMDSKQGMDNSRTERETALFLSGLQATTGCEYSEQKLLVQNKSYQIL